MAEGEARRRSSSVRTLRGDGGKVYRIRTFDRRWFESTKRNNGSGGGAKTTEKQESQ